MTDKKFPIKIEEITIREIQLKISALIMLNHKIRILITILLQTNKCPKIETKIKQEQISRLKINRPNKNHPSLVNLEICLETK